MERSKVDTETHIWLRLFWDRCSTSIWEWRKHHPKKLVIKKRKLIIKTKIKSKRELNKSYMYASFFFYDSFAYPLRCASTNVTHLARNWDRGRKDLACSRFSFGAKGTRCVWCCLMDPFSLWGQQWRTYSAHFGTTSLFGRPEVKNLCQCLI